MYIARYSVRYRAVLIQMTEIRSNLAESLAWTAAETIKLLRNAIDIAVERGAGHFEQIPPNQRGRCLQFRRLILPRSGLQA